MTPCWHGTMEEGRRNGSSTLSHIVRRQQGVMNETRTKFPRT